MYAAVPYTPGCRDEKGRISGGGEAIGGPLSVPDLSSYCRGASSGVGIPRCLEFSPDASMISSLYCPEGSDHYHLYSFNVLAQKQELLAVPPDRRGLDKVRPHCVVMSALKPTLTCAIPQSQNIHFGASHLDVRLQISPVKRVLILAGLCDPTERSHFPWRRCYSGSAGTREVEASPSTRGSPSRRVRRLCGFSSLSLKARTSST